MSDIQKVKEKVQDIKILIVDDEPELLQNTALFLRKIFNNVIEASNGKDGLLKFEENPDIGIVLTDIIMPELDGISMASTIKKMSPKTEIIFLSASASPDNYTIPNDLPHIYLRKPITIEFFLETLDNLDI